MLCTPPGDLGGGDARHVNGDGLSLAVKPEITTLKREYRNLTVAG